MSQTASFYADKKSFRTRNSDNANLITFETGEYQKNEVLEVVKLPDDAVYKITVECVDQPEQSSTE